MDHSGYYYKLNQKSIISDELLDFAKSVVEWKQPAHWATFLQKAPPLKLLEKDPLLAKLLEMGWSHPAIFKSFPNSYYQFHIDKANRPVALNMLLGEPDSLTFFLGKKLLTNQYDLLTLKYEPHNFYLLNTTKHHAVMNFDQERFVFTICPPARFVRSWDPVTGTPADRKTNALTEESKRVFELVVKEFKEHNL